MHRLTYLAPESSSLPTLFSIPAGFLGSADLWRSPDHIVVGRDLLDLLWSVGPAESFAT